MHSTTLKIADKYVTARRPLQETCIDVNTSNAEALLERNGFLILRNALDPILVSDLAGFYFSLFERGFFTRLSTDKWRQNHPFLLEHGTGNHPANTFVRSALFFKLLEQSGLDKTISDIFPSCTNPLPRIIVRCFSQFSRRSTLPHRDIEYIQPSDPKCHKAITVWLPLTQVDETTGQLIYFPKSHTVNDKCNQVAQNGKPLDREKLPELFFNSWVIPEVKIGDVLIHDLYSIHSGFTPVSREFVRLSLDLRYVNNLRYTDPRWLSSWRGDDAF